MIYLIIILTIVVVVVAGWAIVDSIEFINYVNAEIKKLNSK